MGGRYKSFNYEISVIPDFLNTISVITPQLFRQSKDYPTGGVMWLK